MRPSDLIRGEQPKANAEHSSGRSGRDIDAEHGSGRGDPEDVEPPGAIGSCRPDNLFLKCRISAMLSPGRSRRRSHRAKPVRRRKNLEQKRKFPFPPRKPLISLKTAEEILGNVWRKWPQIWKCLAWRWKSLEGRRSGNEAIRVVSSGSPLPLTPQPTPPPAPWRSARASPRCRRAR